MGALQNVMGVFSDDGLEDDENEDSLDETREELVREGWEEARMNSKEAHKLINDHFAENHT